LRRPLLPWQQTVAAVAGEYDPDTGRPIYPLVTVSVPRQCGKTVLAFVVLSDKALTGEHGWYTADTGVKARRRWRDWVDGQVPPQWKPKGTVRKTAGDEVWAPPGGGRFRPFPPNRDAIHGEQADTVMIDEAWSHPEDDASAIVTAVKPAGQTRPAPQMWVLSAAGDYSSTWWHGLCEAGRAGTPGHAHFEWRAPDEDAVFNPETWPAWHPGVGHLFQPAAIPDLLTGMSDDDAIRSYGNLTRQVVSSKWPPGAWAAACVPAPDPMPAAVALSVDVSPDRGRASIGAAHLGADGRPIVQLLAVGDGTAWLAAELTAWLSRTGGVPVAYDTKGQAAQWVKENPRLRVRWVPHDVAMYVRASSGMYEAVIRRDVGVLSSPELDTAAGLAVDRPLTDTWLWSRGKSPGDITPLVAVSLAWQVATSPQAAVPRFVTRAS
jgi:hypothetical protein